MGKSWEISKTFASKLSLPRSQEVIGCKVLGSRERSINICSFRMKKQHSGTNSDPYSCQSTWKIWELWARHDQSLLSMPFDYILLYQLFIFFLLFLEICDTFGKRNCWVEKRWVTMITCTGRLLTNVPILPSFVFLLGKFKLNQVWDIHLGQNLCRPLADAGCGFTALSSSFRFLLLLLETLFTFFLHS